MLLMDSSTKISFNRCIRDGDLIIIGSGSHLVLVFSNKGGFVSLLAPTPELWTLVLSHRTLILYIADISFVIMYLEVVPGCLVLESGTGSGSLTTSFARAVAPTGHVYTFDFHEQRVASAREDFERTGISTLITVGVRNIQGEGFPDQFFGLADSVFLDLPQPWLAISSARNMLKQDGTLCSFSPCIEQVQRSCEILRSDFTVQEYTFEIITSGFEQYSNSIKSFHMAESKFVTLLGIPDISSYVSRFTIEVVRARFERRSLCCLIRAMQVSQHSESEMI
ncbi:hypothetical protein GOBAR_AA05572 [Gossypium barbadense]|uniref:tRNA (adenine(58)-N(1))-methyltransferase n=1 Tax=Gossypium barbadense TaxID=3634 RepID=A0A2P5YHC9_GOSBA|nr:hypothetical protein GOBAR_AA05572 [Gossypium barbadense]